MRIGLLSDTHNNTVALLKAVQVFHEESVNVLFHCGDLTDVDMVWLMEGFQVFFVYGNIDKLTGEIQKQLLVGNPANFAGHMFDGEICGKRIAAIHGNVEGQLFELAHSGKYDFIFHGHSHQFRDLTMGETRIINPGALGGRCIEPRSIVILDLPAGIARRIIIPE